MDDEDITFTVSKSPEAAQRTPRYIGDSDNEEDSKPKASSKALRKSPLSRAKAKPKAESQASKKRKRHVLGTVREKDDDEVELEQALFGGGATTVNMYGTELARPAVAAATVKTSDPAQTTVDLEAIAHGIDTSETSTKRRKTSESQGEAPAAWVDENDAEVTIDVGARHRTKKLRSKLGEREISGVEYQERLRTHHQKTHTTAAWAVTANEQAIRRERKKIKQEDESSYGAATVGSDDESADDQMEELFASTRPLTSSHLTDKLGPDHIAIGRMRDANVNERTNAVVQGLQFHPNGQILAVAGLDRVLRLFEVDGTENPLLQSVFFRDLPITSAVFSKGGGELYISGTKKSFYVFNMNNFKIDRVVNIFGQQERKLDRLVASPDTKLLIFLGEGGHLILVSNLTLQWIGDLYVNGKVVSGAFTPEGLHFHALVANGDVYVFNIESQRCVKRYKDEGTVHAACLSISPDGKYLAIGQDTGIVNLYDTEQLLASAKPKPIKTISNLVTRIAGLQFNHDSQLLAIYSSEQSGAIRLVHVQSASVYQNWPKENLGLGRISAVAFSPTSGYMAIGSAQGNVRLFKLFHYYSK